MNAHTKGIGYATSLVTYRADITREDFDATVKEYSLTLYKRASTQAQFIEGANYQVEGRFFCNDVKIARHVNHLLNAINAHKREENFAKACGSTLDSHRNNILYAQYEKAYDSLLTYNFPAHIFHSDKDGYLILSPVNFVEEEEEKEEEVAIETLTELVLPHTEEVERYYILLPLEAPYTPQNFPCLANGCYDYENFTLEDELNIHRLDSGVVRASKTPMRGIRFDYVHGHGRCACGSYVALEHEYSYCKCGREYLKSGVLFSNRNAPGLTDKEAEAIACAQYERASVYLQAAEAEVEKVKQAIEVSFTMYPEDRELFRGQTPRTFEKYERIAAYDLRCAQEDLESIVVDLHEDRQGIQESEKEAMPTTNEQAPLNEGVDNIGDIDYGYVDPDGNDYHYDCRPNHVKGTPVTYNQEGNRILTALCAACGEPLVSYEDAYELWRSLDTSGGDCDINDPVALYAEKHNSTSTSIDGFIAGYYGYSAKRNMTPQQYANWTGYDFQRNKAWEDGYAIGVAQAQEVEE